MQDQIANLLSGMTKSPETLSVLPPHTDNNGNTDKRSNAENNGHTDNSHHPDTTKHTRLTGKMEPAEKEIRFCTIVEVNTLKKIRIIAKREGLQIKEVVGAAFQKAIVSYEAKHGRIDGTQQSRADSLF